MYSRGRICFPKHPPRSQVDKPKSSDKYLLWSETWPLGNKRWDGTRQMNPLSFPLSSTSQRVVLICSTSQANIPANCPDVSLQNLPWTSSQCNDTSHFIALCVFPLLAFLFTHHSHLDLSRTKVKKLHLYLDLASVFYKTWTETIGAGSGSRK